MTKATGRIGAVRGLLVAFLVGTVAMNEPYKLCQDEPGIQFEAPTDWSPTTDGLHLIKPSARGFAAGLNVDFYRTGKDGFASAADYINFRVGADSSKAQNARKLLGIKKAASPQPLAKIRETNVGGLKAKSFEIVETKIKEPVPGSQALPAGDGALRVRNAYTVLPVKDGFWVLRYSALEQEFKAYLPHYEHLLETFRLR